MNKVSGRLKRKKRIRKKIYGTTGKPRLTVFRSNKHIAAQIINDDTSSTLLTVSSTKKGISEPGKKTDKARGVGKLIAAEALKKNITTVVFDRNGYLYHGRVKALADGAREAGLKF